MAGESRPGLLGVGSQLRAIMASDFLILIGIFFPSVTGTVVGPYVCVLENLCPRGQ